MWHRGSWGAPGLLGGTGAPTAEGTAQRRSGLTDFRCRGLWGLSHPRVQGADAMPVQVAADAASGNAPSAEHQSRRVSWNMAELAPSLGSVAFHDVAIYFSQMEWKRLEDWQKELYKNVIKEIHDTLMSMGYAIDNPGILFRIKNDEKDNLGEYQDFDRGERRENTRRLWKCCHPDILLSLKEEEEPYLRTQQDSKEDVHSLDPSAGGYSPSDPGALLKIEEVDNAYFPDPSESCESGRDSPMNHSINIVTIKQEEEEPYFMDHRDVERSECTKPRKLAEGRNGTEEGTECAESPSGISVCQGEDDVSPESLQREENSGLEWLLLEYPAPNFKHKCSARHASVPEMENDILEVSRNEDNTKRHTKWAVSIFKGWLAEHHLDTCFETISKSSLNKMLREFFATVRNSSGKQYSMSSYAGLRAGVNRFFNITRSINIVKDPEFTSANSVFMGIMKCLRKLSKNVSKHNPRISDRDLHVLKTSPAFSTDTARGLLAKVWFDLQFYFARRGQEGHRDLMPQSFRISKDEQGIEYVTLAFNEKNKQHLSKLITNKKNDHGCMYALPHNPLCPVNSLKKYLSKLPENPSAFYLHPIKVRPELLESQPVWYTKEPLGLNYLRRMMPTISQEAGLSLCYTNHSVWSTVIHLLSKSGLQARHLISDSAHKRKGSIDRYWAETTQDRPRLSFLVPVAAPSTSSMDHILPMPCGLGTPVKFESTPPDCCK